MVEETAQTAAGANAPQHTVNLTHLLPKGATTLPRFEGNPSDRPNAAAFVFTVKRIFQNETQKY